MKQAFLLIAILSVASIARSQSVCDSCCTESFPYEFCSPTGILIACSSNPNADSNASKAFIPSCILVDTMPSYAMWQPIGPPPASATLLSNSALGNDSNEEAGASTQFDSDQTLYNQIPAQAPVPPIVPTAPVNTCGDEPYPDPVPVNRHDFYENYVSNILGNSDYWQPAWNYSSDDPVFDGDSAAYAVWCAQWVLDSETFVNGDVQETTPYDPSDPIQYGIIVNAGNQDTYYLWDLYKEANSDYVSEVEDDSTWAACDSTYEADSAAFPAKLSKYEGEALQYTADSSVWVANGRDYVQVFNQSQAQNDADSALAQWLHVCEPPIQPCPSNPPCCIHVEMDPSPRDFGLAPGDTNSSVLAQTVGNGPSTPTLLKCKPTKCESSNMTIEVNITTQFLSTNRQQSIGPNPSLYTLYQVNQTSFFTGAIPVTETGYSDFSFFELMEHEIGHCFGLHHPDDSVDGHQCTNCYTGNPFSTVSDGKAYANATGYRAVMALNNIVATGTQYFSAYLGLSGEDSCQFQKLYCNSCQDSNGNVDNGNAPCAYDDGVATPDEEDFKAEIFPNPTTGACTLQYQLLDRELVQVAIYDVLGNQIRAVSSGYEEEGVQTMSLGTESLPSGNYVCRVRVGDVVSYINLVIQK